MASSLFDNLPDEVIIHILSFLPTKYAVLTSVLSKRWEFLWCYATNNLHLDDHVTFHEYASPLKHPDRISPFYNFIDRVLKLTKTKVPQIGKFFLSIDGCLRNSDRLVSWIREVVSARKAKEVEIYFSVNAIHNLTFLPLESFNSTSLTVLKLHCLEDPVLKGSKVSNSQRFSLPNLKVLHFWLNDLSSRWMLLVYLFRASPSLEEANFGGGLTGGRKNFYNIYAPSLKRLRMKFICGHPKKDKFFVMAPNLEELVVVDNFFHRHVIKSSCLVSAKLDFGLPFVSKIQGPRMYVNRVCKLLRKISHVKFLNLKAHTMDALSMNCNENLTILPHFHALRCLRLCFVNYSSWDVLPNLLECAPNLEILVLNKDFRGKDSVFRKDSTWIQPTHVPACLLSCLHRVEVYDCQSHQVEFSLISYLLKHGEVLNTFLVELLPANLRQDLRFRSNLMMVPRASKACKLETSAYPNSSQRSSSSQVAVEENNCLKTQLRQVPPQKFCYEDLRLCTDYFSDENLMARTERFKVYRGKFHHHCPYGLVVKDVVVKKWVIPATSPFDEHKENSMCCFREELKLLKHPDIIYHPYFMSLLGYCAEDDNERLGMVYDFKPLDRLENIIPKDSFSWLQRIKVALILACILEYMHENHHDFPSVTPRLNPASVIMDEDYMPVLYDFKQRLLICVKDDEAKYECDLRARETAMRKDYDGMLT